MNNNTGTCCDLCGEPGELKTVEIPGPVNVICEQCKEVKEANAAWIKGLVNKGGGVNDE